jgi:hypothetical protein
LTARLGTAYHHRCKLPSFLILTSRPLNVRENATVPSESHAANTNDPNGSFHHVRAREGKLMAAQDAFYRLYRRALDRLENVEADRIQKAAYLNAAYALICLASGFWMRLTLDGKRLHYSSLRRQFNPVLLREHLDSEEGEDLLDADLARCLAEDYGNLTTAGTPPRASP